ncbi:hypothetical protein [Streptomyces albidoflavus]|uniref:hypothetical protein n=1 Tax=Streptomyces albidoflavus TaxID=1886 RepID=UPI000FF3FC15|nr:hypothetical protein [Streptomyces albidoflavus]RWZ72851.1 hypothetical protein EQK42_27575 [Streptomyces albidoflavus]
MSVPEENRRKTGKTGKTAPATGGNIEQKQPRRGRHDEERSEGRTMGEALQDADVKPEDYDEK